MICRAFALIAAAVLLLWSGYSEAQEEGLGSFYGSQNIRSILARYAPMMAPDQGNAYELMFGFNTSSRRTEVQKNWKLFYGVALGGGGFTWEEADLGKYKERGASAGYVLIQLEGKLFASTEGPVRPYVGTCLGLGNGYLWMEDKSGLPDPPEGTMDLYFAGIEAGVHISADNNYSIILGVEADARMSRFSSETKAIYPAMIYVGLSRWLGPLP